MTAVDQETRIKRAAEQYEAIRRSFNSKFYSPAYAARLILEAADREPWPTDASVDAHRAVEPALTDHVPYEVTRARLRAAMVMDPIVREAVTLRYKGVVNYGAQRLVDAVKKAGL